jgi:hypothetical protein
LFTIIMRLHLLLKLWFNNQRRQCDIPTLDRLTVPKHKVR